MQPGAAAPQPVRRAEATAKEARAGFMLGIVVRGASSRPGQNRNLLWDYDGWDDD